MRGDRRFAATAANLWNRLPDSVRTAKTLLQYETHLFTVAFYDMLMWTFLYAFIIILSLLIYIKFFIIYYLW